MSKVDRNNPKRAQSSESQYTMMEFDRDFPDDAACLDYLVAQLHPNGIHCPKCDRVTKHYRDNDRPAYSCEFCGHREYPMAGTIFQDSATSLRLWFYAIRLMASTRCGISAKQLERELGVTYKTAWRIANKIRSLMSPEELAAFAGPVELDEAYLGGRVSNMHRAVQARRKTGGGPKDKTVVFGIAQRGATKKQGKVGAKVVPTSGAVSLIPEVKVRVLEKAIVYTDEWRSYNPLTKSGYQHTRVNHKQGVYVSGDAHTNTMEGFWSLLKRGISGVYHSVSDKHLQSYLDEYTFRYNNRDAGGRGIFTAILDRVEKVPPTPEGASE